MFFFLIQKFHVAFNELCLCIYIKKTKQKKNFKKIQDFQNFPKKREKFSKKKIFGLGTLDFLVTFSKKAYFFSYKDFKILKSLLFKMVHEDPLDKTFSKS